MGWARPPSCRAERVLEPVVSQLRIPTGVEWTDLPMLGLSPGPLSYRASDGLGGRWHTPAGQRDGQRTHSYAQVTGCWAVSVRYVDRRVYRSGADTETMKWRWAVQSRRRPSCRIIGCAVLDALDPEAQRQAGRQGRGRLCYRLDGPIQVLYGSSLALCGGFRIASTTGLRGVLV